MIEVFMLKRVCIWCGEFMPSNPPLFYRGKVWGESSLLEHCDCTRKNVPSVPPGRHEEGLLRAEGKRSSYSGSDVSFSRSVSFRSGESLRSRGRLMMTMVCLPRLEYGIREVLLWEGFCFFNPVSQNMARVSLDAPMVCIHHTQCRDDGEL